MHWKFFRNTVRIRFSAFKAHCIVICVIRGAISNFCVPFLPLRVFIFLSFAFLSTLLFTIFLSCTPIRFFFRFSSIFFFLIVCLRFLRVVFHKIFLFRRVCVYCASSFVNIHSPFLTWSCFGKRSYVFRRKRS